MKTWLHFYPNKTALASWLVPAIIVVSGCALIGRKPPPEETLIPWDMHNYADFVRQNIAALNRRYTHDYVNYEFIVDTEYGSTRVQDLIAPQALADVIRQLDIRTSDPAVKVAMIKGYLRDEYTYVAEREHWSPVKETLSEKRGDCKNLSLLLLSMLIATGIEAHGAISNGHMWVNAFYNNRWHVLETDPQTDRTLIYQIPGFYKTPLYKVYPDRTLKRKKIGLNR